MNKVSQFLIPATAPATVVGRAVEFAERHRLLPQVALATFRHVGSFENRNSFLFGKFSRTGFYSYFFVTCAMKTSVVMLGATVAAIVFVMVRRRSKSGYSTGRRVRWERATMMAMPFLLLFALYVKSRPNIGHRQVLFVYFPWSVFLGVVACRVWHDGSKYARIAIGGVAAALATVFLTYYPNYETYFNEVWRNPYRASMILRDSNIDWGTDVVSAGEAARRFFDQGYPAVNYAAFGMNRPQNYGISEFHWLVPSYPFAVGMPEAVAPDPAVPSIVSLDCLIPMHYWHPDLYAREPDVLLNSFVIFFPSK